MEQILSEHGNVAEADVPLAGTTSSLGSYCFLFPELSRMQSELPRREVRNQFRRLKALAKCIHVEGSGPPDLSDLPAVYTYFGQFVNHDISAPTATPDYTSSVKQKAGSVADLSGSIPVVPDTIALMTDRRPDSPEWLIANIRNRHPQSLRLNCLYGSRPLDDTELNKSMFDPETLKFRLGQTFDDPSPDHPQHQLDNILDHDLVRKNGVAMIADQRNDENVIIGQLHLAFMLFHNHTVDALKRSSPEYKDLHQLFAHARELVTRHYQYCVVNDFLKRLVPDEEAGSQPCFGSLRGVPFEFTTAAFRVGHSMISQGYDYNQFFAKGLGEASLRHLFIFTSRGGMGSGSSTGASAPGNGRLPTHWVIDWNRFLDISPVKGSAAELIDTKIAKSLYTLGDVATTNKMLIGLASIVTRNLLRGFHRFMPSGQEVAWSLGIAPLAPEQIRGQFRHPKGQERMRRSGLDVKTPLWFYFLCEAQILSEGKRPGPVAGSIVRGTIRTLLENDPDSILRCEGGKWTPESSVLKLPDGGAIKDIRSFLKFAGVL